MPINSGDLAAGGRRKQLIKVGSMQYFTDKKIRFGALSPSICRIEVSPTGDFEDGNTFIIPDKSVFKGAPFTYEKRAGKYVFTLGGVSFYINADAYDLSSVVVKKDGRTVYRYGKNKNRGELPPPYKTPEVFPVEDSPRFIPPKHGYSAESFIKGERFGIDENANDLYFIITDGDFRAFRRDYMLLTGRPSMPPLSALGMIFSKYYPYTQAEAQAKIDEFEKRNVPLDVLVVDTDWRKSSDLTFGCGYNVNEELFPDMKGFFKYAHERGVEIMMNDHPLPGKNARSAFDEDEVVFREKNLTKFLEDGLDIWWFDRNWGHPFDYPFQPMRKEITGMYIYHDVTGRYYEKVASGKKPRRPLILANISEVTNGSYGGIRETSSHRYPMQWSGDIGCSSESLGEEIKNLVKCSNSMIGYYSSDIGGHVSTPERDDFIRWYQYGCFSPILRPHSTVTSLKTREPWAYDDECTDICTAYVKMRYRLLPVFYREAFRHYNDGLGVITPLSSAFLNDLSARTVTNSYMLSDCIFVSPELSAGRKTPVKEKHVVGKVSAVFYSGTELKGEPILKKEYPAFDFFVESGEKLEKELPSRRFSAVFEGVIRPDKNSRLYVASDDGVRVYVDGELFVDDWHDHGMADHLVTSVSAGREYRVRIEYYQAENEAGLYLYTLSEPTMRRFYLPEGEWVNVFSAKVFTGGKKTGLRKKLREMPLFVKCGAVIPLAGRIDKAKNLSLNEMIFDYYPYKGDAYCGYFYEDDGYSTAYESGEYAKTKFSAFYNERRNSYVFKISATEGGYALPFESRKITLKCNLFSGESVDKVAVDGKGAPFKTTAPEKDSYPFIEPDRSPCFKVLSFEFEISVDKEHCAEIFLKP